MRIERTKKIKEILFPKKVAPNTALRFSFIPYGRTRKVDYGLIQIVNFEMG